MKGEEKKIVEKEQTLTSGGEDDKTGEDKKIIRQDK